MPRPLTGSSADRRHRRGAVVIQAQGELRSLRILQRQPAQRERTLGQQLHRFIGTRAGRKSQYARLMVAALDLTQVPRPLDRVLVHVLARV